MRTINKRDKWLNIRVTIEEREAISRNAQAAGFVVADYLRNYGLGVVVFPRQRLKARIVMDAHGYEGLQAQPLDRDEDRKDRRLKRSS